MPIMRIDRREPMGAKEQTMRADDERDGRPDLVLEQLLDARFSCRAYLDRPVERAVIERLVALAQHSPSWCNTQPWGVLITEGAATERFRRAAMEYATVHPPAPDIPFPESYEGVFRERRRETAWQLYEAVGVPWGDRDASRGQTLENFNLFSAPHVAVITSERHLATYGAVDCGVYLACFLLAAQSLGLATIAQAALASVAPAVREFFDIPEHRQILFGVSFGYADHAHPANAFRTTREDAAGAIRLIAD